MYLYLKNKKYNIISDYSHLAHLPSLKMGRTAKKNISNAMVPTSDVSDAYPLCSSCPAQSVSSSPARASPSPPVYSPRPPSQLARRRLHLCLLPRAIVVQQVAAAAAFPAPHRPDRCYDLPPSSTSAAEGEPRRLLCGLKGQEARLHASRRVGSSARTRPRSSRRRSSERQPWCARWRGYRGGTKALAEKHRVVMLQ